MRPKHRLGWYSSGRVHVPCRATSGGPHHLREEPDPDGNVASWTQRTARRERLRSGRPVPALGRASVASLSGVDSVDQPVGLRGGRVAALCLARRRIPGPPAGSLGAVLVRCKRTEPPLLTRCLRPRQDSEGSKCPAGREDSGAVPPVDAQPVRSRSGRYQSETHSRTIPPYPVEALGVGREVRIHRIGRDVSVLRPCSARGRVPWKGVGHELAAGPGSTQSTQGYIFPASPPSCGELTIPPSVGRRFSIHLA
jgi:hypothetical protein